MTNLFKTRYLPKDDGTESTTALTNANTVFIHTYLGDDSTGNGTREKPYRSATKAVLKAGITYIIFRGVINEAFNAVGKVIVGDDINQRLITSNYNVYAASLVRVNLDRQLFFSDDGQYVYQSIFELPTILVHYLANYHYTLFKNMMTANGVAFWNLANVRNTYVGLTITASSTSGTAVNSIIVKYFNSKFTYPVIKNVVFPDSCIFKYNGINLVQPNFGNDSKANIALLRSAFVAAGMTAPNALILFPQDSFGNEISLVIKEARSGGTHPNILNKYEANATGILNASISGARTTIALNTITGTFPTTGDIFLRMADGTADVFTYTSWSLAAGVITFTGASQTLRSHLIGEVCTRYGDVLDFTLNPDATNEALWASDTGGYVGCFRPAYACDVETGLSAISNVGETGTDSGSGDLLQIVNGELKFNSASSQLWNRMSDTTTINIPNGSNFKGLNAMSQDGSPFGYYIGKKQTLISPTAITAGNALTVGKWYKVYNDNRNSVSEAIVYNGVQYLPEYTFLCVTGVTTFSTLEPGSGSYVKEILSGVLESIEILPYNDMTTPSTFPKFSAPLMGECKLIFYTASGAARYGKTAGEPVKFADLDSANMLTDFGTVKNKISYYDTWAISNADSEFYLLTNTGLSTTLKGYFTQDIPAIKYLRREINGHFDMPYDY